jgi:putative oxidoreductase
MQRISPPPCVAGLIEQRVQRALLAHAPSHALPVELDMPTPLPATSLSSLSGLSAYENHALLMLRVITGAFLVWGVADNIFSAARMEEFSAFLRHHGFPYPDVLAPVSVWAQCLCGLGFISGIAIRCAGLLCAVNFIVAVVMVDGKAGIRPAFPATMLVLVGLYLATRGAGRFAIARLRLPKSSSRQD